MTAAPYQFGYGSTAGALSWTSWTNYGNNVLNTNDMGLMIVQSAASPGTMTITDNAGNKWTQIASYAVTGSSFVIFTTQYPGQYLSGSPGFTFTTSVNQAYAVTGYGIPGVATTDSVTTATATGTALSITVSSVPSQDFRGMVFFFSATKNINAGYTNATAVSGNNSGASQRSNVGYKDSISGSWTPSATYSSSALWGAIALTMGPLPPAAPDGFSCFFGGLS
jgi:hypothetical protein